jgi:hypothetical protein
MLFGITYNNYKIRLQIAIMTQVLKITNVIYQTVLYPKYFFH